MIAQDDLDGKTIFMAILAALLGCQGSDEFRVMIPAALNFGVTPVEIKEIIYQSAAYLGIGRVFPFLKITNEVFKEKELHCSFRLRQRQLWKTVGKPAHSCR